MSDEYQTVLTRPESDDAWNIVHGVIYHNDGVKLHPRDNTSDAIVLAIKSSSHSGDESIRGMSVTLFNDGTWKLNLPVQVSK